MDPCNWKARVMSCNYCPPIRLSLILVAVPCILTNSLRLCERNGAFPGAVSCFGLFGVCDEVTRKVRLVSFVAIPWLVDGLGNR